MDLTKTLIDVIDARSFSNLWYWIVLAVSWSTASHYVVGVPFDMITRAKRQGGEAFDDLVNLVGINTRRLLYIGQVSGLVILGFWAFVMTALLMLAFWYWIEFAQAVVLLAVPMTFVGILTFKTAQKIEAEQPRGPDLLKRLMRHRFYTHLIGMVSIFVTALFGMYQNLYVVQGFGG
ncbi:component of SufBCD complex [Flavimaricola marinus]|uniref:Component of SufBCD complex n=1 Tax=Flavimaricola marinus TaxID=1819565 RepID=A0A238LDF9_9RHOB|nr:component of SufBCD complex [Flavimaricola marinus]SMY07454.1 hypothetical protein LOM8899_01589 [Flavimaricola marinus]